ncbi:MAG: hypothetical protein ACO3A2_09995 [Bdellovibrionia bacterium]
MISIATGLLYLFLGKLLYNTRGHYHWSILPYSLLFFTLMAGLIWESTSNRLSAFAQRTTKLNRILLGVCSVGLSYSILLMNKKPNVIYKKPLEVEIWFQGTLFISAGLGLLIMGWVYFFLKQTQLSPAAKLLSRIKTTSLLLGVLLIFAQLLIPFYSPTPWIDVFVNNSAAVEFLLQGKNPYAQTYVDIYNGAIPDRPGFLYFPGLLFWFAPFQFLFHDLRFSLVAAHVLIAFLLHQLTQRRSQTLGSSVFACLIPLLWLTFPVTYFVLEQSWVDTILILFSLLLMDRIDQKKWMQAAVVLGVTATLKQHAFLISFLAFLRIAQLTHLRQAIQIGLVATGVFTGILLPFLIADWSAFWQMVLTPITSPGYRRNSFGLTDYLVNEWDTFLPYWSQMSISLGALAFSVVLLFKDSNKRLSSLVSALLVCFGFSYLFGKWSYCNYHYLLAFFLLLSLALSAEQFSKPLERV